MIERMSLHRPFLRLLLGRRLPVVAGTLRVEGPIEPILIRRTVFGIPVIEASGDTDAAFGIGFCQGQDRAAQLELLLRAARGTLAELVGPRGLAVDRLSRRVGFARLAGRQTELLLHEQRALLAGFAGGITAGATLGLRRRPHELVLLRGRPTPWASADVFAVMNLAAFLQASNWGSELARLLILEGDGAAALAAVDPSGPCPARSSVVADDRAAEAVARLARDASVLADAIGTGGGSNAWALGPERTASGRPLLASDPHLPPGAPPHWYLAHLRTREWACAGAYWVGTPVAMTAHNGFAAWGVTSSLVDTTDLFLERIGPDGRSVSEGERLVPCEVREERIAVRGADDVVEHILVTPRGPLLGPALEGDRGALSISGTWLSPAPPRGIFHLARARSLDEFRDAFADWSAMSWHLVYADENGTIATQLVARVPRRRSGSGLLPRPGWEPDAGWEDEPVPYESLPRSCDPPAGFVAVANEEPLAAHGAPYLGGDFSDGYRRARIADALDQRRDWDAVTTRALQLDVVSLSWQDLRGAILSVDPRDSDALLALNLLTAWDGRVEPGSAAAAVFEVALAELTTRIARRHAPNSWERALGLGFTELAPTTLFATRRVRHLVRTLGSCPGAFAGDVDAALTAAVRRLRDEHGDDPVDWAWGSVRQLTLRHPLASGGRLARVFNLGPLPCGGDAQTVAAAAVSPLDPTGDPKLIASLRAVIDVGAWDESRFALPGGQSGNPLSPHYGDQLPLWHSGEGVPIPWSAAAVERETRSTLVLEPTG
jgi:penicillin amidase